jgi:hypothetical protein
MPNKEEIIKEKVTAATLHLQVENLSAKQDDAENRLEAITKEHWKLFNNHKLGKQEVLQGITTLHEKIVQLTKIQSNETLSTEEHLRHIDKHYKQLLVKVTTLNKLEQEILDSKEKVEQLIKDVTKHGHNLELFEQSMDSKLEALTKEQSSEVTKREEDKKHLDGEIERVEGKVGVNEKDIEDLKKLKWGMRGVYFVFVVLGLVAGITGAIKGWFK